MSTNNNEVYFPHPISDQHRTPVKRRSHEQMLDHSDNQNMQGYAKQPRTMQRSDSFDNDDLLPEDWNSDATPVTQNMHNHQQDWKADDYRNFVWAIYKIGMKHASPSVLMENMILWKDQQDEVTSERVKSHLQKYRHNQTKSSADFLQEYDAWLSNAMALSIASMTVSMNSLPSGQQSTHWHLPPISKSLASPSSILRMIGSSNLLLGAEVAAYLTYTQLYHDQIQNEGQLCLTSPEKETSGSSKDGKLPDGGTFASALKVSWNVLRAGSAEYAKYFTGTRIPLPVLSSDERRSPLGVAICHVTGLFSSMTQHLLSERAMKRKRQK
jgi:SHAQKYF class myb-like DNA-binding protein